MPRGRSGKAILRDVRAINKGLTDREMPPNGVPGWAARELSYKELLPNLQDLKLRSVMQTKEGWRVEAGGSSRAVCPRCGVASRSRHSRYWRRLKDLPLHGASVTLQLQLGRWRCRNRKCERQIFTERVPGVLAPHAQQTTRLGEIRMLV